MVPLWSMLFVPGDGERKLARGAEPSAIRIIPVAMETAKAVFLLGSYAGAEHG